MQEEWGWIIAIYLFLGGLGAGACMVAVFMEFFRKINQCVSSCPVTLVGATLPGPILAIGTLLLIFDLGQGLQKPWLIINLYTHFSSVMTWGTWILTLFIPISMVYGFLEVMDFKSEAWDWLKSRSWIVKMGKFHSFLENFQLKRTKQGIALVSGVLALGVALYTGLLISIVGPAVPFWSTPVIPALPIPILPLLFLTSALSSGLAITVDFVDSVLNHDSHEHMSRLPYYHLAVILVEGLFLGLLLFNANSSGGAAAQSAEAIISGPYSILFWLFVVGLGIIVPAVIHGMQSSRKKRLNDNICLANAVGVLFSSLTMRFVIVAAGIHAIL